jgi:hypothetical protein
MSFQAELPADFRETLIQLGAETDAKSRPDSGFPAVGSAGALP